MKMKYKNTYKNIHVNFPYTIQASSKEPAQISPYSRSHCARSFFFLRLYPEMGGKQARKQAWIDGWMDGGLDLKDDDDATRRGAGAKNNGADAITMIVRSRVSAHVHWAPAALDNHRCTRTIFLYLRRKNVKFPASLEIEVNHHLDVVKLSSVRRVS